MLTQEYLEKNSSRNSTQLLSKVRTRGQIGDYLIFKEFENLSVKFQTQRIYLKLFNIIVIICDVHFEILLNIFKVYQAVIHSLKFDTSQIITII